ncbi:MAG TPA: hypothetical protein VHT95_08465 [Vicinamibacterales bacterium]|nr:hypothetical protein [Vicinamibacterales bacterium]
MDVKRWRVPLLLLVCFAFRLFFGLSREFFFEDQTQIFLLGFRYYATGAWPFFGPDVVWTRSEIPGALQALLVGLPLKVLAIPESPFVLLNLLSFAAICALAWYACAQLPAAPRWLIWGWFLTIPWTIEFSAHMINTSYILAPAIVFFIGFFEASPAFSLRRLTPAAAHAMMGLGMVWLLQIHMSWPLLIPFAGGAWISRRADGLRGLAIDAAAFAAGALIPGALLLPTLVRFGPHAGTGGVLRNLHPHWVSPWIILTTLARFLSFASLEIARFIATDGAKRLEFFGRHQWLVPLAIVVGVMGIVQPIWMLIDAFRPMRQWPAALPRAKCAALRLLAAASVLLVYASYWIVMEPPQAHAFYVLAPIAFLFAAFWWTFVDSPRARQVAAAALVVSIAFHAGLAWAQAPEVSLYKNREVVATAVRLKSPEMFAHRRDFAVGGGPLSLSDPARPYDPTRDFQILASAYRPGPQGSLHWTITVHNRSAVVAYRDPLYISTYLDDRGVIVDQRHERLKDIFEPGETRTIELNDGFAGPAFTKARLEIAAAEALLPTPSINSESTLRH